MIRRLVIFDITYPIFLNDKCMLTADRSISANGIVHTSGCLSDLEDRLVQHDTFFCTYTDQIWQCFRRIGCCSRCTHSTNGIFYKLCYRFIQNRCTLWLLVLFIVLFLLNVHVIVDILDHRHLDVFCLSACRFFVLYGCFRFSRLCCLSCCFCLSCLHLSLCLLDDCRTVYLYHIPLNHRWLV